LINVICNYIFPSLAALITTGYDIKCIGRSENAVQSYNFLLEPQTFSIFYSYFCSI